MTLPPLLEQWRSFILESAAKHGVRPEVLAAIIWRESRGGDALTPKGPAGTGDGGHGRGLCQVDDRFHKEFVDALIDGTPAWQLPGVNIDYGASILASFLKCFHGDEALAVAAYNAGAHAVSRAVSTLHPGHPRSEAIKAADSVTTGHDYASAVLAHASAFA